MARTSFRANVTFNHLPAISAALRPELDKEVGKSTFRLVGGIQVRTHVITGRLRASWRGIHVANSLQGAARTDTSYAVIEQLTGSRYRPPHPGPVPAAVEEWPKLQAGVADATRRAARAR